MRKFKILFIISLGVICFVLQKGCFKKEEYKLEGRYNLKQVELFDNGLEAHINNSNIEIIKSNNEYTIKGKHFDIKRFSPEEKWQGLSNDDFIFTGKIISKYYGKNENDLFTFSKKTYFYKFENEKQDTLSIVVYPNVNIKEVIANSDSILYDLRNLIYTGKEINDIITITSSNQNLIKYIIIAIKEK